jgi:nucleoside-diphosphate-sugar epimerase
MNENIINGFDNVLKNKRVLITGSSGYIGGMLTKYLLKTDCELLGIDKEASNTSINELEFNLNESIKLQSLIKEYRPDLILHTGTNSALDYNNDLYKALNEDYKSFNSLKTSLDLFSKNAKLMFYSSSYVYSGESIDRIVREDDKLEPSHNFGVGKKFFEQYILRLFPNTVIFRLSSVFGEGEARSPNAIKNIVSDSAEKGVVEIWGSGKRKMQYISIDDVINNTLSSINVDPGIYNLGSNDYLNLNDVASIVANFFNIRISHNLNKPEGESLSFMDNEKIKNTNGVGFNPVIESLEEYLESIKF